MELYERVCHLRKVILNKTQTEFAAELGTSRDVINNIEGDRLKRPDQKEPLLKLMCKKFNISESWLLNGEGEPIPPIDRNDAITAFMADVMSGEDADFRRRLVAVLAKLDVSEWELLERMALQLAEEAKKENQA